MRLDPVGMFEDRVLCYLRRMGGGGRVLPIDIRIVLFQWRNDAGWLEEKIFVLVIFYLINNSTNIIPTLN